MIRPLLIAALFFTITPLLIGIQWLLDRLGLPGWGWIAMRYYRILRWALRIRVRVLGEPVRDRGVLIVSNHMSWADIVVIGSLLPVAFVAKNEISNWPLVGTAAALQRTVFVDRTRRHQTGDAVSEMATRLTQNIPVVLFAEGTSSDGNRVLPFRSALVGAVKDACTQGGEGREILIQPMSVCYTGWNGIPMGRQNRPFIAWYGDLDFMPHIAAFIRGGTADAVVTFGAPIAADAESDRKVTTKTLEGAVRQLTATALRGRPLAAQAVE
jgi:lyso-ornithine lipid O-acyltransferase